MSTLMEVGEIERSWLGRGVGVEVGVIGVGVDVGVTGVGVAVGNLGGRVGLAGLASRVKSLSAAMYLTSGSFFTLSSCFWGITAEYPLRVF